MSEIKAAPLSPEQREEIIKRHSLDTDLLAPFWPKERPKYYTDREALLSHIAYLEEEIKTKDGALNAARWELDTHNNNWDNDNDETMRFDEAIAMIDAALSRTPPGGKSAPSPFAGVHATQEREKERLTRLASNPQAEGRE